MRILAWNCNMGLDRKYRHVLELKPDIAVLSESANSSILSHKANGFRPAAHVWVGDNKNKGLGVFTFGDYAASLMPLHDPNIPYIAPIRISGPQSFNLLAVWACHAKSNSYENRLGPLRRALTTYADFIRSAPTVVAGDFNDNVRWDKPRNPNKHSLNVALLEEFGLFSAYHKARNLDQGTETEPTIFWRDRTENGPQYHIDYCFMPESWLARRHSVTVGTFSDWVSSGLSDHAPLVVDVDFDGS